ncbi:MAG TPA: hypothetical protein VKX39_16680 [Bryobacteraceae bacterium]|jgi:hypothetical protein|nr:hypothetical protein [Bryobacteraceae bacterium]
MFPTTFLKILPAALVLTFIGGCHTSTVAVEASTARIPVVAPAGTVLRVRLGETLDCSRSRPGDRFTGTLESPVMAGTMEVLPKGTVVEGHVLSARESDEGGEAWLAVTLDSCERDGRRVPLETSPLARIAHPDQSRNVKSVARISLPAESILGFTLKSMLAA